MLLLWSAALAAVVEYESPASWYGAVYPPVPIDFTAWWPGTALLGQYPGTGLEFLIGDAQVSFDPASFLTDGYGAVPGSGGDLWVGALQETTALAIDYGDGLRVELYDELFNLVHTTSTYGAAGPGYFLGVTSDVPFRYAHLTNPLSGAIRVDNLYLADTAGPRLAVTGTCPGAINVTLDGATPFGTLVLLTADATGAFVIPPTAGCGGTATALSGRGVRAITYTAATAAGGWSRLGQPVGRALCGRPLQILDQATCELSNVAFLP